MSQNNNIISLTPTIDINGHISPSFKRSPKNLSPKLNSKINTPIGSPNNSPKVKYQNSTGFRQSLPNVKMDKKKNFLKQRRGSQVSIISQPIVVPEKPKTVKKTGNNLWKYRELFQVTDKWKRSYLFFQEYKNLIKDV